MLLISRPGHKAPTGLLTERDINELEPEKAKQIGVNVEERRGAAAEQRSEVRRRGRQKDEEVEEYDLTEV